MFWEKRAKETCQAGLQYLPFFLGEAMVDEDLIGEGCGRLSCSMSFCSSSRVRVDFKGQTTTRGLRVAATEIWYTAPQAWTRTWIRQMEVPRAVAVAEVGLVLSQLTASKSRSSGVIETQSCASSAIIQDYMRAIQVVDVDGLGGTSDVRDLKW